MVLIAVLRPAAVVAAMFLCLTGSASAQSVTVSGAWARATAPGQDQGAVYLTLTSATPDRLTAVSSPDAAMAMLHNTTSMAGMSGMTDMDGLSLPAGQPITLAPHGMHIMLMNLKHPLAAGGTISLDMTFLEAGHVHADIPVQPLTAQGPPP